VDHGGDDAAWADTQLGQHLAEKCPTRALRLLRYSFGPHRYKATGAWYLSGDPSKKSMQRFKAKMGDLLLPSNIEPWPELRDALNSSLLVGRTTSVMGHAGQHSAALTNTSMSACALSSPDGTR
jgi:hypothetical protein